MYNSCLHVTLTIDAIALGINKGWCFNSRIIASLRSERSSSFVNSTIMEYNDEIPFTTNLVVSLLAFCSLMNIPQLTTLQTNCQMVGHQWMLEGHGNWSRLLQLFEIVHRTLLGTQESTYMYNVHMYEERIEHIYHVQIHMFIEHMYSALYCIYVCTSYKWM